MVESFWAVPDLTNVRTPLSILREQAAALTEQTKGVLVGEVDVTRDDNGDLRIRMDVVSPALNNYRYRILSYKQPISMYPGTLFAEVMAVNKLQPKDAIKIVDNESDFISDIKIVLSSEKTKEVLAALIAQSRDA